MTGTQPTAGWYQDPSAPPERHKDGVARSSRVAAALAGLVLLAAIAVVLLPHQRRPVQDAHAQVAVRTLGTVLESSIVDDPNGRLPVLHQEEDGLVTAVYPGGETSVLAIPTGVALGGVIGTDATGFCLFVLSESGSGFQYDHTNGTGAGTCGQGETLL